MPVPIRWRPAQAAAGRARIRVGHGEAAEQGDVGDELVAADHETEAAEQQQRRNRAIARAVELAAGDGGETENDRHPRPGRKPRGVVQRQDEREDLRERGGGKVEERRLLEERLPGERGHHPGAAAQQLEDDAKGVCLVRLPRVAPDEAWQYPRRAQQSDQPAALRHHSTILSACPATGSPAG
jgi:hypothetical protein